MRAARARDAHASARAGPVYDNHDNHCIIITLYFFNTK
jgi:hypothetical protein